MAFSLPDHWVWDMWFADDGKQFHMFYLHAPKCLGNPDLRHRNARIGHATSTDLVNWTDHGLAFPAGEDGAFDQSATWTGSIVRGPDGTWFMFYTGSVFLSPDTNANIETIGLATSPDLFSWTKHPGPICRADSTWYETLGTSSWPEEAWRDPWVYKNPGDTRWHMLVTARANCGPDFERGVVGHAISDDLYNWTVQPPLSTPGAGFGHLEVFQFAELGEKTHLVFSCDAAKLAGQRKSAGVGGVWSVAIDGTDGPFPVQKADLIVQEQHYAGRVVSDRKGCPHLIAFLNTTHDGDFIGGISDPLPLTTGPDGNLAVETLAILEAAS